MGRPILARGLMPLKPGKGPSVEIQLDWLWILLSFHAHRFNGRPIGEMLTSWTTIMLMDRGYSPTIADLAKACRLPRATVARYVDHQIRQGWIDERVNTVDRRRRELFLTEAGEQELESIVDFFHDILGYLWRERSPQQQEDSGLPADLLERLARISTLIAARLD